MKLLSVEFDCSDGEYSGGGVPKRYEFYEHISIIESSVVDQ